MPELAGFHRLHEFATRDQWADAITKTLVEGIANGLARAERVGVVVPGGRTPAPIFERLSKARLNWNRVDLCPSDERWVPPNHPDSNERSIRLNLIDKGATARVVSLWRDVARPSLAIAAIEAAVDAMARPLAAAASGMGEDGHFASLFPGLPETLAGLRLDNSHSLVAIDAPQAGHARMSLTLARLVEAPQIVLMIAGEAKRAIVERASKAIDAALPVSMMLAQRRTPVDIYWSA